MPQAAQQEDDDQVAVGPGLAVTVSAQRDIEIVAEPGRQGDVPAPPEFGDRARAVRQAEVARQGEAEREPEADGHQRIAGEVEIDLQGVGQGPGPGGGEAGGAGMVEHGAGQGREGIGDQHLHGKTDDQQAQAGRGPAPAVASEGQPPGDGAVADDGAGDQLGEEGDVERHFAQAPVGGEAAAVDVDQVTQGVEGEEGDAQRQGDLAPLHAQPQGAQGLGEQARVFEHAQGQQVDGDRACQGRRPRPPLARVDHAGGHEVEADRAQHHQDHHRLAPGVEAQGQQQQDQVLGRHPAHGEIEAEGQRQEDEQEGRGREDHARRAPVLGWGG